MVSASIPFGMSLKGPENAKILTGSTFNSIQDEDLFQRDKEDRIELEHKEREWKEWIEEERRLSVMDNGIGGREYEEKWIEGDLRKIEEMAEFLRKKEDQKSVSEDKWNSEIESRKIEEVSREESLNEAKESLLPGMTILVQKTFSFNDCREKMIFGSEISDNYLNDLAEDYANRVCNEGETHQSYLLDKIKRFEKMTDINEFHREFDSFFREFENSASTFEQFVRSEIRRLTQLMKEEAEKMEKERYRIKNELSGFKELDCSDVVGLSIFGYRDERYEFIGSIVNPSDSNSIANDLGAGNKFSSSSIFNEFGRYGRFGGEYSAFNESAGEPPIMINRNNMLVGYLTLNKEKGHHISPYKAYHCARESFRTSISDHEDSSLFRWQDN